VAAEDRGAARAARPPGEPPIRAAEVVGALSLATDLGTGSRSSAPRTAARSASAGRRSPPRRPRQSSCARPRRDGSTPRRWTGCPRPQETAPEADAQLPAGLTEREPEVLLVPARGASSRQVADDLGISAKTAWHHVQHVDRKAGLRGRTAATVWAFGHDLVAAG
jgi:DNA-binding NarL/FixJ family response regulator